MLWGKGKKIWVRGDRSQRQKMEKFEKKNSRELYLFERGGEGLTIRGTVGTNAMKTFGKTVTRLKR